MAREPQPIETGSPARATGERIGRTLAGMLKAASVVGGTAMLAIVLHHLYLKFGFLLHSANDCPATLGTWVFA
ncbi:MAG: hypothetical protein COA47_05950 [Robiginitomaculum sp.]|nr:MAG: hypothetical protein COA47_05950 [Robiginitomaculum sp.]